MKKAKNLVKKALLISIIGVVSTIGLVGCGNTPKENNEVKIEQQSKDKIIEKESKDEFIKEKEKKKDKNKEEKKEYTKIPDEGENALSKAENYLEIFPMSKKELYNQLKFDKFPKSAIEYAINNIKEDWKENALEKAESYMETLPMSKEELKSQLKFDKFTDREIKYAMENLNK